MKTSWRVGSLSAYLEALLGESLVQGCIPTNHSAHMDYMMYLYLVVWLHDVFVFGY